MGVERRNHPENVETFWVHRGPATWSTEVGWILGFVNW